MASRNYKLTFTPEALTGLIALPSDAQRRVLAKMVYFAAQSDPLVFAAPLKGTPGYYRFRIGDYRAIFRLGGQSIEVLAVGQRKNIYLKLN